MNKKLNILLLLTILFTIIVVINPYYKIDILLIITFLLGVGYYLLKDKLILVFLLLRPTLDYWRDYNLLEYKNHYLNINSALAVLVIIWSISIFIKYRTNLKKVNKYLILFFLFCLLSISYSFYPGTTFIEITKLFSIIALFSSAFILSRENIINQKSIKISLFASAIIPIILGITQLFTGSGINTFGIHGRIYGTLAHPNVFAFYILFLFFIFIQDTFIKQEKYWQEHSNLKKIIYIFFAILILATYTRAAIIGGLIFVTILGLYYYRKKTILILSSVIILYLLFFPLNNFLKNNFNYNLQNNSLISRLTQTDEDSDSWAWRQALIRENIPIIKEKPLFGYGYGVFAQVWENNRGESHYWDDSAEAHNDYLRLILEIGAIGSLSYLLFLFSIGKNIWQKIKINQKENLYLLAWLISFLALSFTDNMLHHTAVMWLMWSWFGFELGKNQIETTKK